MANVKTEITNVERTITLTVALTETEAEGLKSVCGLITGPHSGPRGVTDEIWQALDDANVKHANTRTDDDRSYKDVYGSTLFVELV